MRIRTLQRMMGDGVKVTRARGSKEIKMEAEKLGYSFTAARFDSEAQLAEHAKSLAPCVKVGN